MDPKGAVPEIKAEVPMAEMLDYPPDLRAITGGQGEYTMDLARYEEVPTHVAQQVVQDARAEAEAVKA
jgi:elongation factor G